jgi:hypothetical protein
MVFDNIQRNFSSIVLFTLLFAAVFWIQSFIELPVGTFGFEHSVFTSCPEFLESGKTLSLILSLFLTSSIALFLYQLNNNHLLLQKREHLIALIFVILTGAYPFFHSLSGVHIASIFVLLSLNSLFTCYRRERDFHTIFLTFMYVGLASMFCSFTLILFIPSLMGLLRFMSVRIREITVAIAGLLCPYYFASFVSYFTNGDFMLPATKTIENITPKFQLQFCGMTYLQCAFAAFAILFVFVEIFKYLLVVRQGMTQKTVSCNIILIRHFIFCIIAGLLFPQHGNEMIMIAAIPATVMISRFFASRRRNLQANLLFALFVAAALVSCYCSF